MGEGVGRGEKKKKAQLNKYHKKCKNVRRRKFLFSEERIPKGPQVKRATLAKRAKERGVNDAGFSQRPEDDLNEPEGLGRRGKGKQNPRRYRHLKALKKAGAIAKKEHRGKSYSPDPMEKRERSSGRPGGEGWLRGERLADEKKTLRSSSD